MKESVADGITVNLVYEGRAAKVILDQKKVRDIELYYKQCEDAGANEEQIAASKKAVANLDAIIGDDDVLAEVAKQLNDLLNDIKIDKEKFKELGISFGEKAFYDILVSCARKFHFENQFSDDKMKDLAKKVKALVDDKTHYTDWDQRIDVKAEMEADLMILLDENGYPPEPFNEVYAEVFEQAENFKKYAE